MMQDPTRQYRKVQVATAAQDDLLILLLDGGVRFCESALIELRKERGEDIEKRHDQLLRAQKILLELMGALSPAIGVELYEQLMRLYRFTFERLFEGNLAADLRLIEEGTEMMHEIRDIWREAVARAKSERRSGPPPPAANGTLSVQG
ncbi:MAG: flagellar export chaperone FliS [Planctomycetota bacterium]|jgi:flagellar protein FliS